MSLLFRRRVMRTGKIFATVLYMDGTLIIHEDPARRDSNITLHGAVVKEYNPS